MASLKGVGVLGEAFSSVRLILGVQLADLQQIDIYICMQIEILPKLSQLLQIQGDRFLNKYFFVPVTK